MPSLQKKLTAENLKESFGDLITPEELAAYLKIDKRTLLKNALFWGGVEIYPGKFRFFADIVKGRLSHARLDIETRKKEMARSSGAQRKKKTEAVSGCIKKIPAGSFSVGKRGAGKTQGRRDPHGIFDDP
jgi:hypothetical protein